MFLRKCASCRKDIPTTITECPYCHSDPKGQPVTVADLSSDPSLATSFQSDLDLIQSDDPFVRQGALDRLSQKGSAVVPILINLLSDHSRKGMNEVAKLLGRLKDRRAIDVLVQALKIGDEELRLSAVWALSQMNDPQVVEELLHEAERAEPTVQAYLAHVLSGYQDARVVPVLVKLARQKSREVSFQAVWALGEAGDASAITPLRRLLSRKDLLSQAAVTSALRRLGGPVRRAYPVLAYAVWSVIGLSAAAVLFWQTYR